ncbi:EFR1 family ferrodoxin [Clostridium luticellarii]|jgi:ferredoxin|uniref:Ferredoxin n=1 Tax=Clostridium luticellarii TaxID=1691940 RepID=A0A2T0BM22_9CLOT|nr:EFR1 family ferrodoxin [Clostridium luticellarii]MCI1945913.1 EFR1 family ferrodoxin [Clostridium luticellarii]MCI1969275.1 EFR1 family ferrodoxin [Clostridium luticellarii]MCI1996199.1 EFR1 family ferrodoxin [Clostridium luticellarii]MCI2040578.1 EFR1 family ferrodoxin [Clostridium luticellarii]PRR84883.1 ferredoxin [Clostridium luticellarii]
MKGVLYYFSGTGNTKWVADKFRENFALYNVNIDLVNIQNIRSAEDVQLEGYDFLIIGSPVYAEFPPKIVIDFLNKFYDMKKDIKLVVYSTQAASSASAPCVMAKSLRKKGYIALSQISIKMPNNNYFSIGKKPDENEIKKILFEANAKVKNTVENFMNGESTIETTSFIRLKFNKLIYNVFKNRIPKLSQNISSTEDCGKCGLCLRNCPQGNITFESGRAIFHSKCMLCLRCIYICPKNAVRYKNKKIDQTQRDIIKCLDLNK